MFWILAKKHMFTSFLGNHSDETCDFGAADGNIWQMPSLFISESFRQLYYLIWSLNKSCVSMIDLFSSSTQGSQSNTTISRRSVVCFCLRTMPKMLSIFSLAREVPTLFLQTNQSTSLSPKSVAWAIQYIVFWLLLMVFIVDIYIYISIYK